MLRRKKTTNPLHKAEFTDISTLILPNVGA